MQRIFKREQLFKEMEYPARYNTRNIGKSTGILFGVLFTFLMLYKPFGVYEPELKFNYILICALHALSPSLIVYVYFNTLNYYRKRCRVLQEWTLFQECCQLSFVLFLIGIASFLMRGLIYNNPDNWSLRYFGEEVRNCFLAGSLFYFYLLLTDFYFQSKTTPERNLRTGPIVGEPIKKGIDAAEVFINTQVKQDDFSFNPNDLLFAKAEGNYVELTLCKNAQLTTELKRISLRKFESTLADYPFLFRCHRAYLVNIMQIEKISGNSQGYMVSFQLANDKIPVSRGLLNSFDSRYKQIHSAVRT